MAKCVSCGKQGFFVRVSSSGLCRDCNSASIRSVGSAQANAGEVEDRVARGESVLRVVPRDEESLMRKAEALIDKASKFSERKQDEKAVGILSEVIAMLPNHFGAYINRGNAYKCLGQTDKAIQDYRKAIQINPTYYVSHVNLAATYLSSGKKEEAIKLYKEVLAMIPRDRTTDVNEVKRLIDKARNT